MRHSKLVAVAMAAACFSTVGAASAQTKVDAYTYTFTDDDLLADTLSSPPPIIKGGPRPRRIMLLRPRASFVAEMLKAVETL
jgi:hypothetical protein